jgi:hypothetical protein
VAQRAGTTPRQTEGAPAARLARWALRAVITVTALGVALAACGNSSDPVGNGASRPATGDAAKIEATTWNGRKHRSLINNDGMTHRRSRDGTHPHPTAQAPAGPPVA